MPAIDSIPLLLAADMWQVIFGIIVFVLYSIGQMISAREQAKKKPAAPRKPRRPQGPAGQPAVGQGNQEEALKREVEDFLRRAQGKPPRQEQPARPQSKSRPQKRAPNRLVDERPKTITPSLPLEPTNLRHEGVAEHVASHLSSKKMIDHAEHLGDDVGLADERLESRLHQKFDHRLGSLEREEKSPAPKKKKLSAAEEVVELLRKPGGMRQVVIAQEILRRPEW